MSAMVPTCNNTNKNNVCFHSFSKKKIIPLPFPGRTWYSDQAKEQWSRHSLCSPNPRYVVPGKLLRRRRRGRGEPRRESEWEKRRGPKSPVIRSNKALWDPNFRKKKQKTLCISFQSFQDPEKIVWTYYETNCYKVLWCVWSVLSRPNTTKAYKRMPKTLDDLFLLRVCCFVGSMIFIHMMFHLLYIFDLYMYWHVFINVSFQWTCLLQLLGVADTFYGAKHRTSISHELLTAYSGLGELLKDAERWARVQVGLEHTA